MSSKNQYIKLFNKLIALFAVCGFLIIPVGSFAQAAREYNIKAVFLYNFTQFVDWPDNALTNSETPFVIGILGNDPFGPYIDETVEGEKIKGHQIIVQRYKDVKDIKSCEILFICSDQSSKVREILNAVSNKNILTVSDLPAFAKNGGMIRFMTQENKIKLQINPGAAKAADLNISSKLLRVADIVDTQR